MKPRTLLIALLAFQLKLAADPAPLPGLPEPFVNGTHEYHHAQLLSVDATGITFQHDGGRARIPVRDLDPAVKHYITAAMTLAQATPASPAKPVIPTTPAPPVRHVAPAAPVVVQDPEALTVGAKLWLTGQAQGGKSRYEPWKTDYGSYQRVDTSSYQLMCTIKTLVQTPQRVRMQAFRISRNLDNNQLETLLVGDFKVTYGGHIPTTVSAICLASNSDNNYVALGTREVGGDKYLGWIWRAIDGASKVVAVVSSQSTFDRWASAEETPIEP
jgi:hypothetical protein